MPLIPTIAYTSSVVRAMNFEHPTTGQNNVQAELKQLTSDMIENTSAVAGASVTDALDVLGAAGAPPPLSRAFFVDVATTVQPDAQSGAISTPFTFIQAAVDIAPDGSTIYVCPGDYSAQNPTIVGKALSIVGMMPGDWRPLSEHLIDPTQLRGPSTITTDSFLTVENISVASIVSGNDVVLFSADVGGVTLNTAGSSLYCIGAPRHERGLPGLNMFAFQPRVGSVRDIGGFSGLIASGYTFGGIGTHITIGSVDLYDCKLLSTTGGGGAGPAITGDGLCGWFRNCILDDGLIITGSGVAPRIELDSASYSTALQGTPPTTFTAIAVRVPDGLLRGTISVVVPAIAASTDVDYADVSTVGTPLEGVDVGDVVLANPTADLVAAGAGGGFLNCRVSAANTIRLTFRGVLAGGASDFIFCRVDPALAL